VKVLFLLAMPCLAQPVWTSIATQPFQYFRYGGGTAVEHATNPHPPLTYHFMAAPAPTRTVCAIENRTGVYWFTPAGVSLNHTFATSNPTEFNVSGRQEVMRGFAVEAAFRGPSSGGGSAVEVVYFTNRACSDGGVEYGFSRDLAADSVLVYWSTFANCGIDAASLCRKTNDPSLGEKFSNVQQEDGGANTQHGFRIYGLSLDNLCTYRIFVEEETFRVEVLRGGKLASCSETAQGARHPCTFRKRVEPWFPIRQLNNASGYIVAGTQTVGQPVIDKSAGFIVSDILVRK
jgi:hypothetical protein